MYSQTDIIKIYIKLLDGSTAWVPVSAERVNEKYYKILLDNEYIDYIDPLYLHEYYPGDIVTIRNYTFSDNVVRQLAKRLVERGNWPDRLYNEFKFKATLGKLAIDDITANLYNIEIERIKKEIKAGRFFYPAIIEAVTNLDKFI